MMNKLILGRYLPGDSLIHRLDPRAKLVASFYFIAIIFLANNLWSYLFLGAFTLFCLWLSKIDFGFFLRGVKPLIWLILFTVALQIFFTSGVVSVKSVDMKIIKTKRQKIKIPFFRPNSVN